MRKFGLVVQQKTEGIERLIKAGARAVVVVENPGLLHSLKHLAPEETLWFYRDWSNEQPLDDPKAAAEAKLKALGPALDLDFDGYELYNEIGQHDLATIIRFTEFQLRCLDGLARKKKFGSVDNDSTGHTYLPEERPEWWEEKSKVYDHPAARWRCRHEYLPTLFYEGDKANWFRHLAEIRWLRENGKRVLDHIIGEWGFDKGPPRGPWHPDFGVTREIFMRACREYEPLVDPVVIANCYFGAGLDPAWPYYGLLKHQAPDGLVDDVIAFMQEEPDYEEPSWEKVEEVVKKWYRLLASESFHLWPNQTIPYKGVELHGDRIGAVIMWCETAITDCDPNTRSIEPAGEFNGVPFYAWGLMQIIARVPGHTWFSNRPSIEDLKVPAINIKWGLGIFHGSLMNTGGDLWEALRRYSGHAAPKYTMSQFYARYGEKFRKIYKKWFGVDIPPPELDLVAILTHKVEQAVNFGTAARGTLEQMLTEIQK